MKCCCSGPELIDEGLWSDARGYARIKNAISHFFVLSYWLHHSQFTYLHLDSFCLQQWKCISFFCGIGRFQIVTNEMENADNNNLKWVLLGSEAQKQVKFSVWHENSSHYDVFIGSMDVIIFWRIRISLVLELSRLESSWCIKSATNFGEIVCQKLVVSYQR